MYQIGVVPTASFDFWNRNMIQNPIRTNCKMLQIQVRILIEALVGQLRVFVKYIHTYIYIYTVAAQPSHPTPHRKRQIWNMAAKNGPIKCPIEIAVEQTLMCSANITSFVGLDKNIESAICLIIANMWHEHTTGTSRVSAGRHSCQLRIWDATGCEGHKRVGCLIRHNLQSHCQSRKLSTEMQSSARQTVVGLNCGHGRARADARRLHLQLVNPLMDLFNVPAKASTSMH